MVDVDRHLNSMIGACNASVTNRALTSMRSELEPVSVQREYSGEDPGQQVVCHVSMMKIDRLIEIAPN